MKPNILTWIGFWETFMKFSKKAQKVPNAKCKFFFPLQKTLDWYMLVLKGRLGITQWGWNGRSPQELLKDVTQDATFKAGNYMLCLEIEVKNLDQVYQQTHITISLFFSGSDANTYVGRFLIDHAGAAFVTSDPGQYSTAAISKYMDETNEENRVPKIDIPALYWHLADMELLNTIYHLMHTYAYAD